MICVVFVFFFFFFQAEDGIRDDLVTGVQTCALPISGEGLKVPLLKPNAFPMATVDAVAVNPWRRKFLLFILFFRFWRCRVIYQTICCSCCTSTLVNSFKFGKYSLKFFYINR